MTLARYCVVFGGALAACSGAHDERDAGPMRIDAGRDAGVMPDAADAGDYLPDGRLRCESALCRGHSCCPDPVNGAYCCGGYTLCDETGCHCGSAPACPLDLYCCGDHDGGPPCTDRLTASMCGGM